MRCGPRCGRPRHGRRTMHFSCLMQLAGSNSQHCCYQSRHGRRGGRSANHPSDDGCRQASRQGGTWRRPGGVALAAIVRRRRPEARCGPAGPSAAALAPCRGYRPRPCRTQRSGAGPRRRFRSRRGRRPPSVSAVRDGMDAPSRPASSRWCNVKRQSTMRGD